MLIIQVPDNLWKTHGPSMAKCRTCLYWAGNAGCCDHMILTGKPRKRTPESGKLREYLAVSGGKMPPPNCRSWEKYDPRRLRELSKALTGIPQMCGER